MEWILLYSRYKISKCQHYWKNYKKLTIRDFNFSLLKLVKLLTFTTRKLQRNLSNYNINGTNIGI